MLAGVLDRDDTGQPRKGRPGKVVRLRILRAWAPICGLLFSSSPRKYAADVSTMTRSTLPPGECRGLGLTFGAHGVDAERAGDDADAVLRAIAAGQVIAGNHAIAQVVGVLAGKVDDVASVDFMQTDFTNCEVIGCDAISNQNGNSGFAVSGLGGERIDKAALQYAIPKPIRLGVAGKELRLSTVGRAWQEPAGNRQLLL